MGNVCNVPSLKTELFSFLCIIQPVFAPTMGSYYVASFQLTETVAIFQIDHQ